MVFAFNISEESGTDGERNEYGQNETDQYDDSLIYINEYIDLECENSFQDVKGLVHSVPSKIAPAPIAVIVKGEKNGP